MKNISVTLHKTKPYLTLNLIVMKKILLSILNVLFICFCFAQKGEPNEHPPIIRPGIISVNCLDISPPNCNYIRNNNFAHPNYTPADFGDPFGLGKVPEWYPASGTPQVNEGVLNDPAPVVGMGYFFGAVDTYTDINTGLTTHNYEGIVQKIPKLIPGHTYAMSFFKSKKSYANNYPVDRFKIRFIDCEDYNNTFDPNSGNLPPVPTNNQLVYCETVLDNLNWQQVFIHFTAASDYNMIWIYPDEDPILDRHAGLYFAYPQLIDISAIQNQVIQATQPECMATLPYCGPLNSVFDWEGPNGQIISGQPSGQPVQIDVTNPLNIGNWTFTLTMPSATIISPMSCSSQGAVTGSVTISNVCNAPPGGVWPKSYSYTRGTRQLTINPLTNHFLVQYYAGCTCFSFQHNHAGVPIPTSGTSGNIRIHYNGNNALSDYYIPDGAIGSVLPNMFCNNSGELLTRNGTTDTKVFDFSTGQLINSLPFSDEILAQTSTNKYLTLSATNVLKLTDAGGIVYYSIQLTDALAFAKYDKANDILYYYDQENHYSAFQAFPTTIGTLFQHSLPAPTPPSGYIYNACSIADNGIMYYLHNQTLMKYDPATTIFSLANFAGLNNIDLLKCKSSNPYIDNRILVLNPTDNFLYLIDHLTGNVKKINYQGREDAFIADYSFDNGQQHIFLTGITRDVPLIIGAQVIPIAPGESYSVFVTKLNMSEFSFTQTQDNFSARQAPNSYVVNETEKAPAPTDKANTVNAKIAFDAAVSPNPVRDQLSVIMPVDNGFSANSLYTISIYNNVGVNVLELKKTGKTIFINTQRLNPGSYFILIRDEKGNRYSKAFIKI